VPGNQPLKRDGDNPASEERSGSPALPTPSPDSEHDLCDMREIVVSDHQLLCTTGAQQLDSPDRVLNRANVHPPVTLHRPTPPRQRRPTPAARRFNSPRMEASASDFHWEG